MFLRQCLLACCLLLGTGLTAQSSRHLDERLDAYARATENNCPDELLACLDPELFDYVPRQLLAAQLEAQRTTKDVEVTVTDFTVDQIGKKITEAGTAYVPVRCHHDLNFRLRTAAARNAEAFAGLTEVFTERYGAAAVSTDAEDFVITVRVRKQLYAIDRGEGYHFIEHTPGAAGVLDLLVPLSVRERLTGY